MEDWLIEARIASRALDAMPAKQILKETVDDCDGDEAKAKRLIRKYAETMLGRG